MIEVGIMPGIEANLAHESNRFKKDDYMKRLCLYAGYSDSLVIDEYVLFYLRNMSYHSDIYYFAASNIPEHELTKLDPFVKGRHAIEHDKYDFGSWQKLIYNIGWDKIETYDALILANDSNYGPISDLSAVFEKMDRSGLDFWGITENNGVHIHIQSYFVNIYKKVFSSRTFHDFFESIIAKKTKEEVCLEYEIGLSKSLYGAGFLFGSYIDRSKLNLPYGDDISSYQNTILKAGAPFLKRKTFTQKKFPKEDIAETFNIIREHDYPEALIVDNIKSIRTSPETKQDSDPEIDKISESTDVLDLTGRQITLRSIIKRILMPIYRPIKYRIFDKIYNIERNTSDTRNILDQLTIHGNDSFYRIQNSLHTIGDALHAQLDRIHRTGLFGQEKQLIVDQIAELQRQAVDTRLSIAELHGHIDWTQRDILIALKDRIDFKKSQGFSCITEHPVAYDSPDYIHPVGTLIDHTRHPRFIRACEDHFADKPSISFLDLGCSAGGVVWDAVLRGHIGVGLEGSDISRLQQRAEWRLLRENLFTCDITKPFKLTKDAEGPYKFDVISAWEVLEHLTAEGVHGLFKNLASHTSSGSIFACSISQVSGGFTEDGTPFHPTLEPLPWWKDAAAQHGFSLMEEGVFSRLDFARGNGNASIYYRPEHSYTERPGDCLLVLFKRD